ncbi:MAG TPA: hypothetical protein VGH28_20675 [Polyangiaceae bacterium]
MTRRLELMPEVLPAPTKVARSESVRSRTVAHMQRLLATAAVLPLADCTRADTQSSQTVTIPVSSATAPATATSTAQGTLLPPPTATVTATATATAPNTGYAVVDPMPAPARCLGLAAASKATASLKQAGADWVIDIAVTLPAGGAWSGTAFAAGGTISPWSGTIVRSSMNNQSAKATLKLSPGTTSAGLTFPVSCAAGSGSIAITASFTGPAHAGAQVSLSKNDY